MSTDFDVCDVVLMFLFAGYERAIKLRYWLNLWLHVRQTGQSALRPSSVCSLCRSKTKHIVGVIIIIIVSLLRTDIRSHTRRG